jgi:hypothetical protein
MHFFLKLDNVIITIISFIIAKFSVSFTYAIIRLYSSELLPNFETRSYFKNCTVLARLGQILATVIIGFVSITFSFCTFCIRLSELKKFIINRRAIYIINNFRFFYSEYVALFVHFLQ